MARRGARPRLRWVRWRKRSRGGAGEIADRAAGGEFNLVSEIVRGTVATVIFAASRTNCPYQLGSSQAKLIA
jgi:hypothetical protein